MLLLLDACWVTAVGCKQRMASGADLGVSKYEIRDIPLYKKFT